MMTVCLGKNHRVSVKTLAEASAAVRRYLDDSGMGSSEWYGDCKSVGVVRLGRKTVAHVSYNGRVWDK
jgi:hypothetical protein